MKTVQAVSRADILWQNARQAGIHAYAKGPWIFNRRPLSDLTEVLGIGAHRELNRMMRLSGVDESYITGGASDYDKLEALFKVLPMWIGHPYGAAVSYMVKKMSGLPPSLDALPDIWRRTATVLSQKATTYEDLVRDFGVGRLTVMQGLPDAVTFATDKGGISSKSCLFLPDLKDSGLWSGSEDAPLGKIPDMAYILKRILDESATNGCLGVAVDLSGLSAFVRPNPYTPAKAVEKLQKGQRLTEEEGNLVVSQGMRLLGQECLRRQWPLAVIHPSRESWLPLCAYLADCQGLPEVTVISEHPWEVILSGMRPKLIMDPFEPSEMWGRQIALTAAQMPLGCLDGLYLPMEGTLDLWAVMAVGETLCRSVAGMEEALDNTGDVDSLVNLVKGILC